MDLDEEVAGWCHPELRTAAHCPSGGQDTQHSSGISAGAGTMTWWWDC